MSKGISPQLHKVRSPLFTPPSAALTQVSAATSPANPDIQNIARENLGSTTETTQLERDKASAEQFFRSGEENLAAKNYLEAIDDFEFSREYYGQVPNSNLKIVTCTGLIARAHLELGYALVERGDFNEASNQFTDALQRKMYEYHQYHTFLKQEYIYEHLRTDIGQAYFLLGFCYFKLGNYEEAKKQLQLSIGHFEQAIKYFKTDKDNAIFFHDAIDKMGDSLTLMGEIEEIQKRFSSAIEYYNRSLEAFNQKEPRDLVKIHRCIITKTNVLKILATICKENSDFTGAIFNLNQVLTLHTSLIDEICENKEIKVWLADLHHNLAFAHYKTQKFSESIEHFEKSLSIRKALIGENSNLQKTKLLLALSLAAKGDELVLSAKEGVQTSEIEYYERAISFVESIKFLPDQMDDTAVHFLHEADRLHGIILESLASLNLKRKDFGKSNAYLQKAIALKEKEQPAACPDQIIKCQKALAMTYFEMGQAATQNGGFSQAIEHFKKEFSLAKSLSKGSSDPQGSRIWFANIHHRLGDAFAKNQDFSTSIEHYKKALRFRKYIFGLDASIVNETLTELAKSQIELANFHSSKVSEISRKYDRDLEEADFARKQRSTLLKKHQDFTCKERNPLARRETLDVEKRLDALEKAYWTKRLKDLRLEKLQHRIAALGLLAQAKGVDDPQVTEAIKKVVRLLPALLSS